MTCYHWTTHVPEQTKGRAVSRAGQPILLCRQSHCAGRHGYLCIHHLPERVRSCHMCSPVFADFLQKPSDTGVIIPGQKHALGWALQCTVSRLRCCTPVRLPVCVEPAAAA